MAGAGVDMPLLALRGRGGLHGAVRVEDPPLAPRNPLLVLGRHDVWEHAAEAAEGPPGKGAAAAGNAAAGAR
eukprot:CAMPEP_0179217252 /NCGR_PEP_ID=MMETSP0797-20121207/3821_1 /TAXON_ID=47934 /ORGANISM="Dinophysis acuminata, Strain DAEP01" /LENGTH=71 /DNA_ID=CAMNT_0020923481 /DNA_START=1 /DNA_END=214 /DNA_ORIENTATION=-